jgi:hypothetical protein
MVPDAIERRQQQRHRPREFIAVHYTEGVGEVMDISSGGMSFKCPVYQKLPQSLTVDIIDRSGNHLADCPVEKVWVCPGGTSFFSMGVGVRFAGLSESRREELERLISGFSDTSPLP